MTLPFFDLGGIRQTESGIEIPKLEDVLFLPNLLNTFEFKNEETDRLKVEMLNFLKDKTLIPYSTDEDSDYQWIHSYTGFHDHHLYVLKGIENVKDGFRIDFGAMTNPSYRTEFDFVSLSKRTKYAFLKSKIKNESGRHDVNGLFISYYNGYEDRNMEVNPWAVPIFSHIYLSANRSNRS